MVPDNKSIRILFANFEFMKFLITNIVGDIFYNEQDDSCFDIVDSPSIQHSCSQSFQSTIMRNLILMEIGNVYVMENSSDVFQFRTLYSKILRIGLFTNHNPNYLFFRWIVLGIVIWHIFGRMKKTRLSHYQQLSYDSTQNYISMCRVCKRKNSPVTSWLK